MTMTIARWKISVQPATEPATDAIPYTDGTFRLGFGGRDEAALADNHPHGAQELIGGAEGCDIISVAFLVLDAIIGGDHGPYCAGLGHLPRQGSDLLKRDRPPFLNIHPFLVGVDEPTPALDI